MRLSDDLCREARALIASRLGLDFPESRQADLERGLSRACRASSISAPEAYLAWLATLPDQSPEWRRLAGHLTVGETYFFRDRVCFEALEHQVLPALIAARRAEGLRRLRLWSAGCATGEEPYSLAILLDRLLPDGSDWALTILATDINPGALEAARHASYREWSFRETPQWVRDRYFHRRRADGFELDPRIRRMVTLAPLNLAKDGYPSVVTDTSSMDLILCRNVLMYFTHEAQRATAARLQKALVAGGWLGVSPAEASAGLFPQLVPVNFPGAILYRKDPPSVPDRLSSSPAGWALAESPAPLCVASVPAGAVGGPPVLASRSEERAESQEPIGVPADLASDVQRARALADQGRLDDARSLCEAVLARDRLDPEAHLLLAAICQEVGEIRPALEALRRALYLAPDSAPAHFLLGSLLLRQGQRQRGRRAMETVVRLLSALPGDELVAGSDGLTAGRLRETARAYLESS